MATNIGTAVATFATANMKPAVNDQADALWAQNIGDNLGHLFYREIQLPVDDVASAVYEVRKTAAHNGVKVVAISTDAVAGVAYIRAYPAGTTTSPGAAHEVLSGTYAVPAAAYARNTYKLNISSLTNGSYYDFTFASNQDVIRSAYLIHGTDATY